LKKTTRSLLIVNFDEQLIILCCKRTKEEEKEKHAKKRNGKACYHCFLYNKTFEEGDNSCHHLLCSNMNQKKKVMTISLLLSPSSLQAKENKMGSNNKFVIVALFATKQ